MLSKGLKRNGEEEETMEALSVDSCWLDPSHPAVAQTPPTVASSSLFDLSVVKLHHSLRQSEPDLRHLVLVVNTLRRIQASMEPAPVLPPEPIQPPAPSVADSLLASSDAGLSASMASLLEDLNHIEDLNQAPQPQADEGPPGRSIGGISPNLGALDLLGQPLAVCWTMDWRACLRTSIPPCTTVNYGYQPLRVSSAAPENGPAKEEPPELDEAELTDLMDVLVGTQALERPPAPGREPLGPREN
uniref:SERTA domain-containing protein n=1 Tax=Mus musculus TaxID=10090 RepID=Q9DCZ2_MOUSE|nr:unnamed protein product [Mus musculus]